MNKKQSGFSVVELVMALVIVVLLGVVGWLAWDRMQKLSSNNDAATSKSSTNTNASSNSTNNSSQTNTSSIDGNAAASMVAEFYGKYAVFGSDREELIKQYGTTNLLSDWNSASSDPSGAGSDPIECAQAIPESVTVTGHSVSGSTATVSVKEAFGSTDDNVTVSVVNQNGLKIDHVTCPQ